VVVEQAFLRAAVIRTISIAPSVLHAHSFIRHGRYVILKFNVCGSVHLGNIRCIRIQLDVQYYFFLKSGNLVPEQNSNETNLLF
jgi:hypothetical protein